MKRLTDFSYFLCGMILLDIFNRCPQQFNVIFKVSQSVIAWLAEKSSHQACFVAMINYQCLELFIAWSVSATDRTSSILYCKLFGECLEINTVIPLEGFLAISIISGILILHPASLVTFIFWCFSPFRITPLFLFWVHIRTVFFPSNSYSFAPFRFLSSFLISFPIFCQHLFFLLRAHFRPILSLRAFHFFARFRCLLFKTARLFLFRRHLCTVFLTRESLIFAMFRCLSFKPFVLFLFRTHIRAVLSLCEYVSLPFFFAVHFSSQGVGDVCQEI